MAQPRYTLDEAEREIAIRDCRQSGHAPRTEVRAMGEVVGVWLCQCGQYSWRPAKTTT